MAKRHSVNELAHLAGLNVEDSLLRLWDAGIEDPQDATYRFDAKDLKGAKRALGIATGGDFTSPTYWQRELNLDESGLRSLLETFGISFAPGMRRLPKGSVIRLKAELRARRREASAPLPQRGRAVAQQIVSEFKWERVGDERDLRFLTVSEVRNIHFALVDDFSHRDEPISPAGVRSDVLLEAAVNRVHTSLGRCRKYPTLEIASAALLHSLVHDHPFHNGNKRTGLVAMLVFLDENGHMLTCDQDELFRFVLTVADHHIAGPQREGIADREVLTMAQHWVERNTRIVTKGDRIIPFRTLRQILLGFGCRLKSPFSSQIRITRTINRGWLRLTRTRKTCVHYDDEGRDVEKSTVSKIRRDLELDEQHGVDSRAFYDKIPPSVGDFIVEYRKTLGRLATL